MCMTRGASSPLGGESAQRGQKAWLSPYMRVPEPLFTPSQGRPGAWHLALHAVYPSAGPSARMENWSNLAPHRSLSFLKF